MAKDAGHVLEQGCIDVTNDDLLEWMFSRSFSCRAFSSVLRMYAAFFRCVAGSCVMTENSFAPPTKKRSVGESLLQNVPHHIAILRPKHLQEEILLGLEQRGDLLHDPCHAAIRRRLGHPWLRLRIAVSEGEVSRCQRRLAGRCEGGASLVQAGAEEERHLRLCSTLLGLALRSSHNTQQPCDFFCFRQHSCGFMLPCATIFVSCLRHARACYPKKKVWPSAWAERASHSQHRGAGLPHSVCSFGSEEITDEGLSPIASLLALALLAACDAYVLQRRAPLSPRATQPQRHAAAAARPPHLRPFATAKSKPPIGLAIKR